MKINFVVSAWRDIWQPNVKRLFAADLYVFHVIEREGWLSDYEEVSVAPPMRATQEEFLDDHEFVDKKFNQYSEILADRLDKLHQTNHGIRFWRKAFSLSLLRHVTLCYDMFKVCEVHLNPEVHDCCILDMDSYKIPMDFDEHRYLFQNTDCGREQLFSVYCNLFYPDQFSTMKNEFSLLAPIKSKGVKYYWKRLAEGRILDRIRRRIKLKLIYFIKRIISIRPPSVGIMECYFSRKNMSRLVFKSCGQIQHIPLPTYHPSNGAVRWDWREQLIQNEPDFGRFDKFVFACLKHGFPRLFVEDFSAVCSQINSYFNRFPSVHTIVCEFWIGCTLPSLTLAVLRQRGIRHIYNEHNYLSYFFQGTNLKYLAPLVDEFVTLGWKDSSMPNLVRGASLYEWVSDKANQNKEHEVLFIMGVPIAYLEEINSAYGTSGAFCAASYLDMNKKFLSSLGEETLGKMYVRSYPLEQTRNWLVWDQAFILGYYMSKVKVYDDNSKISSRSLMQRSRLVVVNYLSTSYLESIIADIPTVFISNEEAYLFNEKNKHCFDELIAVGVCQTNPENAANFVNKIISYPEQWWKSEAVQNARKAFLDANIGKPDVMIQYLLNISKKPYSV
jgi:putative transferase (TIGR04331 family)